MDFVTTRPDNNNSNSNSNSNNSKNTKDILDAAKNDLSDALGTALNAIYGRASDELKKVARETLDKTEALILENIESPNFAELTNHFEAQLRNRIARARLKLTAEFMRQVRTVSELFIRTIRSLLLTI